MPHIWASFNDSSFFNLEEPDWPVVTRNEVLNMRGIGNENLK